MDISVSRLNQRMALQIPAELPLGLVFVVGKVHLPNGSQPGGDGEFYLIDSDYRLPCRLSERAATETHLNEGDMVRAGGHLAFEPSRASYFLLARDIERVGEMRPAARPLAAIIADNNRREQASTLTPAALPPWVLSMAPPEVRQRLANQAAIEGLVELTPTRDADLELLADTRAAVAYPEAEPALAGLSDELIAFLSHAMDSEQEVEITAEIISDFNSTGTTDRLPAGLLAALEEFEVTVQEDSLQPGTTADLDQVSTAVRSADTVIEGEFVQSARAEEQPSLDLLAELEKDLLATAGDAAQTQASAEKPQVARQADGEPVPQSRPARPVTTAKEQSRLIPWYVVLLVIIAIIAVLAILVLMVMNPPTLPLDLPFDFVLPG